MNLESNQNDLLLIGYEYLDFKGADVENIIQSVKDVGTIIHEEQKIE